MSKIYLNIILCIFTSILTIGCLFILFFSPHDSLVKFVPAESTLYLHSQNNFLYQLPENQKKLLLNWLTTKSTLNQSQWDKILQQKNKELALFAVNGQFFSLMKNNLNTKQLLINDKISFTEVQNILYIPAIKINNNTLTTESWYQKIRKHFNFSNLIVYIKNPRTLDIPNTLINNNELPMVITNTLVKKNTCYNINGQIGFNPKKKQLPSLPITSATIIYFNNIQTNEIIQKVDYTLNNFPLLLLKTLSGGIEFVENYNGFVIRVPKDQNSLENIKTNIQFILAQTKPLEKTKRLPDETESIQLIADPSQYQLADVGKNYQRLIITEPSFEINIEETSDDYYIFNNSAEYESFPTKIATIENPFSDKTKQGLLYINPKEIPNLQNLSGIWLVNKNANNISICLN